MNRKKIKDYAYTLDKSENFQHSLDILMEICDHLGSTQISYAIIVL